MKQVTKTLICFCITAICIILIIYSYYFQKDEKQAFQIKLIETANFPTLNRDDERLFDIDLQYTLNTQSCSNNSNILAVILVTSYFGNVETRSAMRRSFSNKRLEAMGFRRVFLLGQAKKDKYTSQEAVESEAKRFGDIVQGNFQEAYRNLTYKHVMGIKWAAKNCQTAKYVIKMDDDIVVNIPKLKQLLESLKVPKKLLAGYILRGLDAKREPANKWHVTRDEYEPNLYPAFVSGWLYVTNPNTCRLLLQAGLSEKYFWIDDVYVTGILARKVGIKHYSLKEYFSVHPEFLQCCMRDVDKHSYDCEIMIGPNGGDNNLFYEFNKVMEKCATGCSKRPNPLNETCVAEKKFEMLGRGNAKIESIPLV